MCCNVHCNIIVACHNIDFCLRSTKINEFVIIIELDMYIIQCVNSK
jgi:hypothetical protein